MFHFRVKAGSLFNSHHGNHIYTNGSHSSLTRCFTSSILHYRKVLSKDQHHDVASYIAYAERTGLDVESKVFVGTHYEYSIASALRPLGFDLRRTGGQSDKGIDLLGTWRVPSMPENFPLQVLLQCKAYSTARSSKIGPQLIRELEGACLGAPYGWRGVGLLVSQRPASKGVREAMGQSRWPLGYVSCSTDGVLQQMLWNQRAEEEGLEGMGVTVKLSEEDRQGDTQRLILIWEAGLTYPQLLIR
ncbi:hypothetical protein E0Z10_g4042 [Xylaria hypoxylon]|uniref:Restriction endonuclease type IV Mrr domain-containing protein n=1 Tax=Xylaria hypoxylon TaxID=37992 RepID=A0A4Z0YM31_9PEZI|nr:hypothetical protein E0Z10_g4042 [Xylaria hypoxylon]